MYLSTTFVINLNSFYFIFRFTKGYVKWTSFTKWSASQKKRRSPHPVIHRIFPISLNHNSKYNKNPNFTLYRCAMCQSSLLQLFFFVQIMKRIVSLPSYQLNLGTPAVCQTESLLVQMLYLYMQLPHFNKCSLNA